ncbi:tyrosine-protein phosphatase [Microbacterium sp.]|uniref:tyrosine-protein phosphatase n=1 Tax=Microbacterium sp. TaxID=51671 RepID=UPI0039E47E4F
MIAVSGAFNFRDVGGLPAGSRLTRSGVLYRSGNLAHLDDDGRATLAALGLRRIVDLRDEFELAHEPSLVDGLGIETVHAPLFLGSTESFLGADLTMAQLYSELVDTAADRIVGAVRAVLADQPVLIHCTVGKDRTGVTVALMLAAAGVDTDAVIADYARTESLLPPERNASVVAFLQSRHPDSTNLVDLATRSPAPIMRGLLEDIDARFGSAADYLRAGGLDDGEIAGLRDVLVAP